MNITDDNGGKSVAVRSGVWLCNRDESEHN